MNRILFLDIDGVLVNRRSLMIASGLKADADIDCVVQLNRITDATGALIVVSSTWRMQGIRYVTERLRRWGVSGEIIGCTPVKRQVDRGDEIQAFLDDKKWKARGAEIESIAIIDDDSDMAHLSDRLIRTEFRHGLRPAEADAAIEMLLTPFSSMVGFRSA